MKRLLIVIFSLTVFIKGNATQGDAKLATEAHESLQQNTFVPETKITSSSQTQWLNEIKSLRQTGKLNEAEIVAKHYLEKYPNDVDAMLLLGLIYIQENKDQKGEVCLNNVLLKSPDYMDARLALIRLKIKNKQFEEAQRLINIGLTQTPEQSEILSLQKKITQYKNQKAIEKNNPEDKAKGNEKINLKQKANQGTHIKKIAYQRSVKRVDPVKLELQQAEIYLNGKQFNKAKALYKSFVNMNPCNVAFQMGLADYYLARHNDQAALMTIRQAIARCPMNVKLLFKKGEVHTILHQYDLAAETYKEVLAIEPNNKNALSLLDEIALISPRHLYGLNEVGAWSDNAYVSDLHAIWDWSNVYYARDMDWGRAILNVGYASRLGIDGVQYLLNVLPRFNRNIYFDLVAGYSDRAALFPTSLAGGEGYWNIPGLFELSAGARHSKIDKTYFDTYTGTISVYPGTWWISFRPYYFVPKDRNKDSILFTGRIRKYFATDDHYIGIGAGTGRSPDLADLLTVNFIVIKNSFVNANYTFPVWNHHIVVDLGVGYQRWVYPSTLVRKLYDASISFRYRFEG